MLKLCGQRLLAPIAEESEAAGWQKIIATFRNAGPI